MSVVVTLPPLRAVLSALLAFSILACVAYAQVSSVENGIISRPDKSGMSGRVMVEPAGTSAGLPVPSVIASYFDPVQGSSSSDLARRALSSNAEMAALRLEIERARARVQQAKLRPNPVFDFEQTSGRLSGSPGEWETSIGFALPLEVGGKRGRQIDLALAELEAAEADVANQERRLIADVRAAYADAAATIRELEITENINLLDLQTARIVEVRVTEGESAPIELTLLQSEVERLKARRVLVEGRLRAAMLRLKNLAGIDAGTPLRLGEALSASAFPEPPASIAEATDIALRTRPDLRLARINEEVALAGLRLARAQSVPDVTAFSKYTRSSSVFDDTPVGVLRDRDHLLTFGVSISVPLFNRNQGAKAEAATAIAQARKRREFVEAIVRTDVASAYARFEAARSAIATFEQGVLVRAQKNITAVRGAYEIGAFKVTDLLVEQRRFVDAQRDFIDALAERYRALADLQSALGLPVKP